MIIDLNSMVHIPSISYYNHNYYTVKENNSDSVLLIESRDDSHEHGVFVCEVGGGIVIDKIFLGSAVESRCEGIFDDTVLVLELLRAYT